MNKIRREAARHLLLFHSYLLLGAVAKSFCNGPKIYVFLFGLRFCHVPVFLENSPCDHSLGNLDKAGNIGTDYQIALHAAGNGGVVGVVKNVDKTRI